MSIVVNSRVRCVRDDFVPAGTVGVVTQKTSTSMRVLWDDQTLSWVKFDQVEPIEGDTLSRTEIVARRNLLLGNGYQGTSVY